MDTVLGEWRRESWLVAGVTGMFVVMLLGAGAVALRYLEQMAQDEAMIALQSDILRRAEAQVQNGVMTETDYLSQLNLLTQAQLARSLHRIQAAQAQTLWRIR